MSPLLMSQKCHKLPNAAQQAGPVAILQRPIRPELMLASLSRRPLAGNLNSAVHAFCHKNEIDNASEFVRNEITYEIGAVAGLDLGCRRGTAKLAPLQDQGCRGSGRPAFPTDRYLAARDR